MTARRLMAILALTLAAGLLMCGCGREPAGPEPGTEEPVNGEVAPPDAPPVPAGGDAGYVTPGTQAAMDRGIAWLKKAQLDDGGWPMEAGASKSHLGVTAVAAHGLLAAGVPADDLAVAKAVTNILGFAKPDGGIYDEGLRNYTTSIALMVLKAAGEQKHQEVTKKALKFLVDLQWGEGHGIEQESPDYGGAGYGQNRRPDLSNTQWLVQAYSAMGLGKDDKPVQNALIFISRCQAGEAAKGYWTSDGQGGFVYTPHEGGESKAGEFVLPSGEKGLKAYGSMTYAGFLSMIYAGLDRTDPRVMAAREWIERHWTLEENPELGMQGYFYYLMTMGKALRAHGTATIIDGQGRTHDWRKELSAKLISLQGDDGSWTNPEADRWYEGNPCIATPFALIGLNACKVKL